MKRKKVILITGASSGIGKATALRLIKEGHKVYCAARSLNKMEDLKEQGGLPIEMDVSKTESIERSFKKIIKENGRIDVLYNNAGFGLYGTVEEIPMEDLRYQFEVNFFGLVKLTQLAIPYMRKQKSGKIINTTSIGGKIYSPLGSAYHATKHAVEGWSDCLRIELKKFGIDVIIIEPGIIHTNFAEVLEEPMKEISKNYAYKGILEHTLKMMSQIERNGSSPDVIAKVVQKSIRSRRPKTRYAAGYMAKATLWMRKHFSDRCYDKIIMSRFAR
ncbi:MAG: oxidoreductase [Alphaproteobacteria bacterium]|jgi:short-subunit dehydrogenase|nr:oxidoreductase [Alphaproteobacteria bacterium]